MGFCAGKLVDAMGFGIVPKVLASGEILIHRRVLARQPDHRSELLRLAHDIETRDRRAARIRLQERRKDPNGGGLARTVRAE